MKVILYLRDYLVPGGIHPYEQLPVDMEKAFAGGNDVTVVSVPGFTMAMAFDEFRNSERPWSDGNGFYYKTAKDCIDIRNGIHWSKFDQA